MAKNQKAKKQTGSEKKAEDFKNIDLNRGLKRRKRDAEHHYITLKDSRLNTAIMLKDVFSELKSALPELDILTITPEGSKTALIVSEPSLNADLTEFFRNKPEF